MQLDTPPGVRPACGVPSLAVARVALQLGISGLEVHGALVRPPAR